jgi:hypothetical protein
MMVVELRVIDDGSRDDTASRVLGECGAQLLSIGTPASAAMKRATPWGRSYLGGPDFHKHCLEN